MKFKVLSVVSLVMLIVAGFAATTASSPPEPVEGDACVNCHAKVTPGWVADWKASKHSQEDVACSSCHGDKHTGPDDVQLAVFPSEETCGECHEEQLEQFLAGKHSHGWKSLNALPVTHMEPDEMMEGSAGCGGCHGIGIQSEEEKKERLTKGYRYDTNACDACHTRHVFSKAEAQDPKTCQQCHMGYDHPQWEMWSSSKHGTRYALKHKGVLPQSTSAPTCQYCHLPGGTHANKVAWGFLAVRLPLPEDKQWAADQTLILKALGVLHPKTGKPTGRLDVVRSVDLVRLTEEDWKFERNRLLERCGNCHAGNFAKEHLEKGDAMIRKADRLMAQAIDIVAGLYDDGVIKKPDHYEFAYPDLLHFKRTGGSYIDQVLLRMFLNYRMRTYQGIFHANPDYAYWYGWAAMTKALGEIKELDKTMRATHKNK